MGAKTLQRIGIHHPRDLLDFDFDAYFTKVLTFYSLDRERLGRFHRNRRSGGKSKKSYIFKRGRFSYNEDQRAGGTLYHCLSIHPNQLERSLQQFIDAYGRGPFLLPLRTPSLLCS